MTTKKNADQWFVQHVLPLEGELSAYLRKNCGDESDSADLLQEVYARIYSAYRKRIPENTKGLVIHDRKKFAN